MLETLTLWLGAHLPYITLFGTRVNVLAQVAGFVGLLLILYSYLQEKFALLFLSGISYIFFIAEGFFLLPDSATLSNVIGNVVALFRNLAMLFCLVHYKRDMPAWGAIPFLVVFWLAAIPTFGPWYSYIPPITVSVYSLCAIQKNDYILKIGALIHETAFVIYHPVTGAYVGGVRQVILVAVLAFSLARMYRRDHAHSRQTLT